MSAILTHVCKPDGRIVAVPADYAPPAGYVLEDTFKGWHKEVRLADRPVVATRVEGLPMLARFVGGVPHIVRRATEAETRVAHANGRYVPMAAEVAAGRRAWERLAEIDAGR